MSLEGQVALVTGAGRGIGKAIALDLAQNGADLILVNRNKKYADAVQADIEKLGRRCASFQVDVSDREAVDSMVSSALEQFGKVDFLINNAGITQDNLFLRMKPEEWQSVMDVNLNGMFYVTKALTRSMMKKRFGRIVNISSVVGFTGNPGQVNYSASKAAIVGFSKSLARELGSRNITCNVVAPGFIETDMTDALTEEQHQNTMAQIPLGRMGTVEEIANAVSFLVSDKANYITGTTIHVNGGMF